MTWWSVAGDIPEMQAIADKLQEEKGINSKKLSERIRAAIPRFEASEEVSQSRSKRAGHKWRSIINGVTRNASVATTVWHARPHLLDPSLASRCMRAAPVAKN